MLYHFYFSRFSESQDLSSFPTRRSSDLRSMQFMRYVIVWMLRIVGSHHDFPQRKLRQAVCELSGRAGILTLAVYQDRKSTRLNSSHRCISYAVFCLKKKNSKKVNCLI